MIYKKPNIQKTNTLLSVKQNAEEVQAATDLVDTVSAEKTLLAHKFSAKPPKVLGEKELVIYTLALSFTRIMVSKGT